jgi:hypothetical protein
LRESSRPGTLSIRKHFPSMLVRLGVQDGSKPCL